MRPAPFHILKLAARLADYIGQGHLVFAEKDLPDWLTQEGFATVRHGVSRGAAISQEWVLKYPINGTDSASLEQELDVFQRYIGTPAERHVPYTEMVRQGRVLVLVQEALRCDNDLWTTHQEEVRHMAAAVGLGDLHPGNVAFRKEGDTMVPVAIDLGEHTQLTPPPAAKSSQDESAVRNTMSKFLPNDSDNAFAEGLRRMGVDTDAFRQVTHRRL